MIISQLLKVLRVFHLMHSVYLTFIFGNFSPRRDFFVTFLYFGFKSIFALTTVKWKHNSFSNTAWKKCSLYLVLLLHFRVRLVTLLQYGKSMNLLSHKKYFVKSISYIWTLISRISSVEITEIYSPQCGNYENTVWKLWKFTLTLFWQKFRESNNFTNKIDEKIFGWE